MWGCVVPGVPCSIITMADDGWQETCTQILLGLNSHTARLDELEQHLSAVQAEVGQASKDGKPDRDAQQHVQGGQPHIWCDEDAMSACAHLTP